MEIFITQTSSGYDMVFRLSYPTIHNPLLISDFASHYKFYKKYHYIVYNINYSFCTADRYNVTTTVLDNALINPIDKFSHNSNPITLSSTSSMTTSLSNYCPTCGNQTKLLQDHVIFLQKQLQTQCKSNEAESKLNQLHSNSIQFLLKEVS